MRQDGRSYEEMRPLEIIPHYVKEAPSSVLIVLGNTKIICSASVSPKIPHFLKNTESGWLKAEYSMLPCASAQRIPREVSLGRVSGRTAEIQRLIGRSLRNILDLSLIPNMTILVDCDVIQADGGTRTLSITGAYVTLALLFEKMLKEEKLYKNPLKDSIAAISVGMKDGKYLVDLCYEEDSNADTDMNCVMTGSGYFVEVQGTSEHKPFNKKACHRMLDLAEKTIRLISENQRSVLL